MTDPKVMKDKVAMGRGYVTMDLLKTANENYKKAHGRNGSSFRNP